MSYPEENIADPLIKQNNNQYDPIQQPVDNRHLLKSYPAMSVMPIAQPPKTYVQ